MAYKVVIFEANLNLMIGLNFRISFIIISFVLSWGCSSNEIPQKKKVENIEAFAKLYGYVRWFHPSDEAQQIDWDKFACYGAKSVENAPHRDALKDSLLKLFLPIAPSLKIYDGIEKHDFDISKITPPDMQGFYQVFWQHSGVNLNMTPANVYKSIRVGRINKLDYTKTTPLGKSIPASRFSQKTVRLKIAVKSENGGLGQLFFEGLNRNDYMNLSKALKPIYLTSNKWEQIVVERTVRPDDLNIFFGINCMDTVGVFIDNIKLTVNHNGSDSVVYENSFNNLDENGLNDFLFDKNLPFNIQYINNQDGNNGYLLTRFNDKNFGLFKKKPEFGEFIDKQVYSNIFIQLPIVLMANENYTFPAAEKKNLRILQNNVIMQHISSRIRDLGSLVIVWNIIQHFFPYFDEVDVDWEKEFNTALKEYYNGEDFEKVLRKITAKLNDGHVNVLSPTLKKENQLPIKWEWIDENLVITDVYDQNSGLQPGTIVKKIANKKAKKYFSEIEPYIPAPTIGFLRKASENISLLGTPGDLVRLDVIKPHDTKDIVWLRYSLNPHQHYVKSLNKTRYKILEDSIYYINLDQISMSEINSLLPQLVSCNGLICDLRGYPNNNSELLNHLLTAKDTMDNWMKIPQIVYPDRKSIEFTCKGWQMVPKQPQIKAPVVFITDENAISYAESVLMIVKYYNLATIIGQPSAGTNGHINKFKLPNGFQLVFTGMKVTQLDDSQHFGKGILPEIYVKKTVRNVEKMEDIYLNKAIEALSIVEN